MDYYIRHVAGEYDPETKLQLCQMCGEVLWTNNNVYYIDDSEPPKGWQDNASVFRKGGFTTIGVITGTMYADCIKPELILVEND